jgi:MoaA/NifB/PqqE/SkfB family radical SAM enzyme
VDRDAIRYARFVANIGYLQVVRHCNHFCGFCSNPTSPYEHTLETMKVLVDDLVSRGYFGVVLTGGEPTLHPQLPDIARYASERGLHVRMITNGWKLGDRSFARALGEAGLSIAHVSIYSVRPAIEHKLRGIEGTLERAFAALEAAHEAGIEINVNCVINELNADHLDENVRVITERAPWVRHFVWNNLDPSMGRAEVNQAELTPRLGDFELSLHRALAFLEKSGRSYRVERVPLCYMTDFAHASTETRKIVKGEERVVHFLDDKQTVRQTDWEHVYAEGCGVCSLRSICGGLFDRGNAYDPGELAPVFVPLEPIVRRVMTDGEDPAVTPANFDYAAWQRAHEARRAQPRRSRDADLPPQVERGDGPSVGLVTEESLKRFAAKRRAEAKLADRLGVTQEKGTPEPSPTRRDR